VLVLRDLAAHHHQPAAAGDHLAVAAPSGYPIGSYDVLQHDHQRLSSTARSGARTSCIRSSGTSPSAAGAGVKAIQAQTPALSP
jgi:hypothetical protein